jgi:hypothetical protein
MQHLEKDHYKVTVMKQGTKKETRGREGEKEGKNRGERR